MTIEMDEEALKVEVKVEERRLGLLVCDCVCVSGGRTRMLRA